MASTPEDFIPKHDVELQPNGWTFEAAENLTLLRSAALAGYKLPSLCRKGSCRACMCQLFDGDVVYGPIQPGLTAEEMADQWILPCQAMPRSALIIDAPGARVLDLTPPKPIAIGPR